MGPYLDCAPQCGSRLISSQLLYRQLYQGFVLLFHTSPWIKRAMSPPGQRRYLRAHRRHQAVGSRYRAKLTGHEAIASGWRLVGRLASSNKTGGLHLSSPAWYTAYYFIACIAATGCSQSTRERLATSVWWVGSSLSVLCQVRLKGRLELE